MISHQGIWNQKKEIKTIHDWPELQLINDI